MPSNHSRRSNNSITQDQECPSTMVETACYLATLMVDVIASCHKLSRRLPHGYTRARQKATRRLIDRLLDLEDQLILLQIEVAGEGFHPDSDETILPTDGDPSVADEARSRHDRNKTNRPALGGSKPGVK